MDPTTLPTFTETIRQALKLNEDVYYAIQQAPNGIRIALAVGCLASLSEALGQSIMLFVNRVRPKRFLLALSVSAMRNAVGYALWTVVVWLVGVHLFGSSQPLLVVASAVGLAYAPQLFAFFELTPYVGSTFALLLSLWSMLAIVVAVRAGLDLATWQAVVAAGLGWILIQLWRMTLGRPVYSFGRWLETRAAGVPLLLREQDIPQLRRQQSLPGDRWIPTALTTHADGAPVPRQEVARV